MRVIVVLWTVANTHFVEAHALYVIAAIDFSYLKYVVDFQNELVNVQNI